MDDPSVQPASPSPPSLPAAAAAAAALRRRRRALRRRPRPLSAAALAPATTTTVQLTRPAAAHASSVPHLGRAWAGSCDRMPLTAESGRAGMDSTHFHSAVMRSTTPRRRQGLPRAVTGIPPPPRWATRQCGRRRAIRCLTWCVGAPRSHLLWPLLAVKRLVGRSHDPPMACAIARIRGSVHFTWPCRRRRWMFSKQQANALERSCSTGRGCRITLGPSAGGVLWSCTRRDERRVGRASGGKISGRISASAEPGADWRRARCAPRARGLPSRPVASSQAREDCTRPPFWRARG